ncbi:NUDIX hydrolase N-terminal domain-containing protein [Streptococcus suis]
MEGMSCRRISGWNGPYVYKPRLRLVCKDVYDMERFEETRQIAAEMGSLSTVVGRRKANT